MVTGFFCASASARTIFPTSSGVFVSALPSPFFTIFGAGHPIFTSITSIGYPSIFRAIAPRISGSEPKSCTAAGLSSAATRSNSVVFLFSYKIPFALTISEYTSPQPISLQSRRNGKSVTPAIGARKTLFSSSKFPIFISDTSLSAIIPE